MTERKTGRGISVGYTDLIQNGIITRTERRHAVTSRMLLGRRYVALKGTLCERDVA